MKYTIILAPEPELLASDDYSTLIFYETESTVEQAVYSATLKAIDIFSLDIEEYRGAFELCAGFPGHLETLLPGTSTISKDFLTRQQKTMQCR